MENFNLNKIAKHVKLQKREGNRIVKKRAGRPRIQPKVRVEIRMDSVLKSKFDKFSRDNGIGPSQIIVPMVKKMLQENGY